MALIKPMPAAAALPVKNIDGSGQSGALHPYVPIAAKPIRAIAAKFGPTAPAAARPTAVIVMPSARISFRRCLKRSDSSPKTRIDAMPARNGSDAR